jgi:isoquinoline 1-oxidoreductase subunit beta
LKTSARTATSPAAGDGKKFARTYHVAYVQHAPMEPRAAVAEWDGDKVTVWTGTQNPFGVRGEIARACNIAPENVRVIVPDFGGGFGGKHSGEAAVEAARIARSARKPIAVRWTREEEFTWAYFRPAAVIDISASLDNAAITSWRHVNINSGPQAVETPYKAGDAQGTFVQSDPPLRHGSYRALAATANNFARECAMDELAAMAGKDPLEFRLGLLENDRLRAVLLAAAKKFGWAERAKDHRDGAGIGLACGTEKGSFVAACVEIAIGNEKRISVKRVCQVFDCGAVINPENLQMQIRGAIIMGIGPAVREAMQFDAGKITNATFSEYLVPRFADVPEIEVELLNHADIPSAGAGETPIICIAPAIANAVYQATRVRVREMPIMLKA